MDSRQDECFGFERLDVWHKAVAFANAVYGVSKTFPREEMFGLTNQLRRASVSVAANIAEGTSRSSSKDQARFFEIAYGSLNEIATMLEIAEAQGYLVSEQKLALRGDVLVMCRMLSGLKRSALK